MIVVYLILSITVMFLIKGELNKALEEKRQIKILVFLYSIQVPKLLFLLFSCSTDYSDNERKLFWFLVMFVLYGGFILYFCREFFEMIKRPYNLYVSHFCFFLLLIIIIIFAVIYSVLESFYPDSFSGLIKDNEWTKAVDFLYFSLMIFTTVGFGDITPQTMLARVMVSSEILVSFGMLVIAVNFFRGGKEEAKKEEEDKKDEFYGGF